MREPTPSLQRPALRGGLDTATAENGNEQGIVLHDRLGLTENSVFIPQGLLPVVALFDGQRTLSEIEAELHQRYSQDLRPKFLENLVQQLDDHLVLDSPAFHAALAKAQNAFLDQPRRPARHAGSAGYPSQADAARTALESMVRRSENPQRPTPRGLVAPHIDLARGREGYSMAYSYLAETEPADLYVVFGTGHKGPAAPVTGLRMDWDTPLGTVQTDREFVDAVHQRLGPASAADQFLHRDEHSLEFQMLFLQHLFGNRSDLRVAGFLCGHLPCGGTSVLRESYLQEILASFEEAANGRRVCFVAGADLSHVGPFFGDERAVDQARLDQLAAAEKPRLAHLENGNIDAFYYSVEGNGNPDRVCGTTPMTLTAALAGGQAELLHYGQAHAADGHQVVSFCSMAFAG